MLPILFSFGPITLKSLNLFLLMAFFATSFVFWHKGKEEHYELDELFDGFLISLILGGIVARVAFIIVHFSDFNLSILKWFDLFSHFGFEGIIGVVAATFFIYKFAKSKKWDAFEILDFWSLALSLGYVFLWLGHFLNGSNFGLQTDLPWGIVFPGVFQKHHPIQLYASFLYFFSYLYLNWLEYHYRTFQWYKDKRKSAQTGFLFSVLMILHGLIVTFLSFLRPGSLVVAGVNFDIGVGVIFIFFGLGLLYFRSGRKIRLMSWKKNQN